MSNHSFYTYRSLLALFVSKTGFKLHLLIRTLSGHTECTLDYYSLKKFHLSIINEKEGCKDFERTFDKLMFLDVSKWFEKHFLSKKHLSSLQLKFGAKTSWQMTIRQMIIGFTTN